jgi:hypothetical protein
MSDPWTFFSRSAKSSSPFPDPSQRAGPEAEKKQGDEQKDEQVDEAGPKERKEIEQPGVERFVLPKSQSPAPEPSTSRASPSSSLSWEDVKKARAIKKARMVIEWQIGDPPTGKRKAGKPSRASVWRAALFSVFDDEVKSVDPCADPAWIPHTIPADLIVGEISHARYVAYIKALLAGKRRKLPRKQQQLLLVLPPPHELVQWQPSPAEDGNDAVIEEAKKPDSSEPRKRGRPKGEHGHPIAEKKLLLALHNAQPTGTALLATLNHAKVKLGHIFKPTLSYQAVCKWEAQVNKHDKKMAVEKQRKKEKVHGPHGSCPMAIWVINSPGS